MVRTFSLRPPISKAQSMRLSSRRGLRMASAHGGTRSFSTRRPNGPRRKLVSPHRSSCGWRARSRGRVSARCRGFLRASPCRPAVFTRGWPAMRSTALSGPSGRKAACLLSPRFLSRSFPAPNRIAMARLATHARRLASISPSGRTSCALKQAGRIAHR